MVCFILFHLHAILRSVWLLLYWRSENGLICPKPHSWKRQAETPLGGEPRQHAEADCPGPTWVRCVPPSLQPGAAQLRAGGTADSPSKSSRRQHPWELCDLAGVWEAPGRGKTDCVFCVAGRWKGLPRETLAATTISDGQVLRSLEGSQKVLCGLEEVAKFMPFTRLQCFLLYTNSKTFSS